MLSEHVHGIQIVSSFQWHKSLLQLVLDVVGPSCVNPDEDEILLTYLTSLTRRALLVGILQQ